MKRTTVFDEMNRLFDEMRRTMAETRPEFGYGIGYGTGEDYWGSSSVPLRMETDDDGYVVHADLPGFERPEIDLRFDDETLTIDADHVGNDDGETWSRRVHEELRVPGDVDIDGIEASYHNGVLEIHLPAENPTEESGHQIEID